MAGQGQMGSETYGVTERINENENAKWQTENMKTKAKKKF